MGSIAPFPGPASKTWEDLSERVAEGIREKMKYQHDAHVKLFRKLHEPREAHVKAWEAWKARPWTWRNYLAHAINKFLQWLERDD